MISQAGLLSTLLSPIMSMMKKKNNIRWEGIFIALILGNLAFGMFYIPQVLTSMSGLAYYITLVAFFPIALIDLFVTHTYIEQQHPHGMAKTISVTFRYILLAVMIYYGFEFFIKPFIPY